MHPLETRCFTDAVVVPTMKGDDNRPRGGAFNRQRRPIRSSLLIRHYGVAIDRLPECPKPAGRLVGAHIFGGYRFEQFGHFLLESCGRLWFARQNPKTPIIWSLSAGRATRFQTEVLDLLGIENPHVFVDRPVSVETLIVPEPAYTIQVWCHPDFVDFMGRYRPSGRRAGKVWLSRSKLLAGRAEGETEIEAALADRDWTIYHPQDHPLQHQLETLGTAAHLAGFAGSAFHNLLLINGFDGEVTLFRRGMQRYSRNYDTIALAKGFPQRVVPVEAEPLDGNGRSACFRLADPLSLVAQIS